jgi:hypothetical protein
MSGKRLSLAVAPFVAAGGAIVVLAGLPARTYNSQAIVDDEGGHRAGSQLAHCDDRAFATHRRRHRPQDRSLSQTGGHNPRRQAPVVNMIVARAAVPGWDAGFE